MIQPRKSQVEERDRLQFQLIHGRRDQPPVRAGQNAGGRQRSFEAVAGVIERLSDLLVVASAVLTAQVVYSALHLGKEAQYPSRLVTGIAFLFALLFVFALDRDGGYQAGNSLLRIRETERILRVSAKLFLLVFPVTFFTSQLFSRWILALAMLFVPLLLTTEKQLVLQCVRWMHGRGYGIENVLIYGAGFTGRRLFSALARSPKLGLKPVAMVDDDTAVTGKSVFEYAYRRERSIPVISGPITRQMIADYAVGVVIVAIPSLPQAQFGEVVAEARAAGAKVAFVPNLSFSSEVTTNHADIDGLLICQLGYPADARSTYEIAKRISDFVGALALLTLTLPVWVVIAILLRLDSPGPILFSQMRIGRGGKPFRLYKFRSMYVEAPKYALHPQEADDPRITKVGRFLRRTSLDELPQLLNVLKGDMSLVGPRPEMPFIVEQYNERHRQRLDVIPGITGLWQLSADRAFLIHENILYDLYYIRHRSFFLDLAILLHTIVFAMKGV